MLLGCIKLCSGLFPHWKHGVCLLGRGQLAFSFYSQSCAPSIERVAMVQMDRRDAVEAGREARWLVNCKFELENVAVL